MFQSSLVQVSLFSNFVLQAIDYYFFFKERDWETIKLFYSVTLKIRDCQNHEINLAFYSCRTEVWLCSSPKELMCCKLIIYN